MQSRARLSKTPRQRVVKKLKLKMNGDTKRRAVLLAAAKGMSLPQFFEYLIENMDEISPFIF
jgi:predicted HicB family RNase H-like nuclease